MDLTVENQHLTEQVKDLTVNRTLPPKRGIFVIWSTLVNLDVADDEIRDLGLPVDIEGLAEYLGLKVGVLRYWTTQKWFVDAMQDHQEVPQLMRIRADTLDALGRAIMSDDLSIALRAVELFYKITEGGDPPPQILVDNRTQINDLMPAIDKIYGRDDD